MAWGTAAARRASVILWLTGGLLVVTLALLWVDADARARTQGTWCERTGRTQHNMALWSEDNGRTWND